MQHDNGCRLQESHEEPDTGPLILDPQLPKDQGTDNEQVIERAEPPTGARRRQQTMRPSGPPRRRQSAACPPSTPAREMGVAHGAAPWGVGLSASLRLSIAALVPTGGQCSPAQQSAAHGAGRCPRRCEGRQRACVCGASSATSGAARRCTRTSSSPTMPARIRRQTLSFRWFRPGARSRRTRAALWPARALREVTVASIKGASSPSAVMRQRILVGVGIKPHLDPVRVGVVDPDVFVPARRPEVALEPASELIDESHNGSLHLFAFDRLSLS